MSKRILTQTTVIKNLWKGWISPLSGMATVIPAASLEGVEGQYAYSNGVTLFHFEKLGQLAPSTLMTAVGDSGAYITDIPLNADMASTGKSYVVLNNNTLVRLDTTGANTETSFTVSSPTSSQNRVSDVIVMKDLASTPVEFALWTNLTSSGGDVSYLTIGSGSDSGQDNSFWKTTLSATAYLTKTGPLKLAKGADGNVYITNGSNIAQITITGAIGSATTNPTRLKFGAGWTAIGACDWKGSLVVIGMSTQTPTAFTGVTRATIRVWFWNYSDTNFTSSVDIPDNYGNAIYTDGTQLVALTNGRNNSSKIWLYNGTDFVKKFETPSIGSSPTPTQGNIESYQDGLAIGAVHNSVAHIYRFFANGYHDDLTLYDGSNQATSVGMVKNLYQSMLFAGVSYASGGNKYKIYYQASFTSYLTGGFLRTRLYEIGIYATIKRFRIYFSQFGSGASFKLSLYRGYDHTTDLLNKTITYTANGATMAKLGNVFEFDKQIPNVSSFYLEETFNHASSGATAAIVERIEVDWTPNILHSAYSGD